jgi:DNA-binding MarR family transcriptional regulator
VTVLSKKRLPNLTPSAKKLKDLLWKKSDEETTPSYEDLGQILGLTPARIGQLMEELEKKGRLKLGRDPETQKRKYRSYELLTA